MKNDIKIHGYDAEAKGPAALPPATGSANSLPKPTVPEVIPIMRRYAALPGNSAGGSLHIVLDDGNVDDDSVRHCIEWARERADVAGVELGEILLRMSRTQRKKLSAQFYAPNAEINPRSCHGEKPNE